MTVAAAFGTQDTELPAALALGAGYNVHQLNNLAPLLSPTSGGDGILDAMGDMVLQDFFFRAPKRRAHRGDLRDDINAIAIVFDHTDKAADLALDPAEPLKT